MAKARKEKTVKDFPRDRLLVGTSIPVLVPGVQKIATSAMQYCLKKKRQNSKSQFQERHLPQDGHQNQNHLVRAKVKAKEKGAILAEYNIVTNLLRPMLANSQMGSVSFHT